MSEEKEIEVEEVEEASWNKIEVDPKEDLKVEVTQEIKNILKRIQHSDDEEDF